MNAKFMQTLEKEVYMELKAMAKERGVTVQEFLRAVIVPDWIQINRGDLRTGSRSRTHWNLAPHAMAMVATRPP